MKTESPDQDGNLLLTFWCVAGAGLLLTGVTFAGFGPSAIPSAAIGAGLALANLWSLSRLVRVYLYSNGASWALVGVLKMVALFGGIFLLVSRDLVDVLPLVVGYGALPAGIVATRLKPTPPPTAQER